MWKTEERIRQDVERLYKGTNPCLSGCCEMEAYELRVSNKMNRCTESERFFVLQGRPNRQCQSIVDAA